MDKVKLAAIRFGAFMAIFWVGADAIRGDLDWTGWAAAGVSGAGSGFLFFFLSRDMRA